ncbi:hypothetical protein [Marinicrinis lubricantis]|uniref:Uncharacterized protein n=1 Tax=Marinicrinis lubricantis TaxID=2086470 RepID=A0ABW1IV55_9BACL
MRNKWLAALVAVSLGWSTFASFANAANVNKDWVYEDKPSFGSTGHAIEAASDGGWVVSGYKDEMFMLQKLSESGNVEWENTYYPGLVSYAVIETSDGGVFGRRPNALLIR